MGMHMHAEMHISFSCTNSIRFTCS